MRVSTYMFIQYNVLHLWTASRMRVSSYARVLVCTCSRAHVFSCSRVLVFTRHIDAYMHVYIATKNAKCKVQNICIAQGYDSSNIN